MRIRTSNPVIKTFENLSEFSDNAMTLNGTIGKAVLSLAILFFGAFWSWRVVPAASAGYWLLGGSIIGFILALITGFYPKAAPYTTPPYAAVEGLLLGTISSLFEARYPGMVAQAVLLTAITAGVMLITYRTGLIRATQQFRSIVMIATISVCVIYLIDLGLGLFGRGMPLSTSNSPVGILFSVVVIGIAALNLILDFSLIEEGSQRGLPKYMEWYGAFALLVTLVWLYVEILRLLSKLQSRR